MKWKVALTAEEAALLITGLTEFGSLADAKLFVDANEETNPHSEYWQDWHDLKSNYDEAVSVKDAIWDEIHHAWQKHDQGEGRGSVLVLDSWLYSDECCDSLSIKGSKVTKKSLAAWVYEMEGLDKAQIIYPPFDPDHIGLSEAEHSKYTPSEVVNCPAKLQLAIDAHKHFWVEKNAGNQPVNSAVEVWLHDEAIRLKMKHNDSGKSSPGISNKVKDVIAQLIKPD